MQEWLIRSHMLLGDEGISELRNSHVLVVGLGGVGAYAAEMLCRSGIGKLTLVDGDYVNESNRNRQLAALVSTTGKLKTEVIKERLLDINPEVKIQLISEYIKDDRMVEVLKMDSYDYVVDAIDTLAPKVFLIYHSLQLKLQIVSSMGAGGKFDPTQIKIGDISKTYHCALARMLRKRLYKLGIRKGFKVVFSPEEHDKSKVLLSEGEQNKKSTVGTISYMPALFGCYASSVVIQDLLKRVSKEEN